MGRKSRTKRVKNGAGLPEGGSETPMSRRAFLGKIVRWGGGAAVAAAGAELVRRKATTKPAPLPTSAPDINAPVGRPDLPLAKAIEPYGSLVHTYVPPGGGKHNSYIIAQVHSDPTMKKGEQMDEGTARVQADVHFIMEELRARKVPVAIVERGDDATGGKEINIYLTNEKDRARVREGFRKLTRDRNVALMAENFYRNQHESYEFREVVFPEDFHTASFGLLDLVGKSESAYREAQKAIDDSFRETGKVSKEAIETARRHLSESMALDYMRSLYAVERMATAHSDIEKLRSLPNRDNLGIIGGGHLPEMLEAAKSGLFDVHGRALHFIVPNSYNYKTDWDRKGGLNYNMEARAYNPDGSISQRSGQFEISVPKYRADFEALKRRRAQTGKLEIRREDLHEVK